MLGVFSNRGPVGFIRGCRETILSALTGGDIMDPTLDAVKTGTSTIGITFDGGVVVGADHRATMGHFIANKSVKKLFDISDYVALTLSLIHISEPTRPY